MTGALMVADRPTPDFQSLVESYVARDYATVARAAGSLVYGAGPFQGVQLGLIALGRLGRAGEARRLGEAVRSRVVDDDPWAADLVRLVLGELEPEEIARPPSDDVAFCQSRFYGGAAAVTAGRRDDGRALFDSCVERNGACLELYLAGVERAAIR